MECVWNPVWKQLFRLWCRNTCLTAVFGTLSNLLENWGVWELECALGYCNTFVLRLQWVFESSWLHTDVFIKTLSHDTKSKCLAKSKRLCLLLTGCIFNHFLLLVSVNRMNIRDLSGPDVCPTEDKSICELKTLLLRTEEFVRGRTLPNCCSMKTKAFSEWLELNVVMNMVDSCSVPLGYFLQDRPSGEVLCFLVFWSWLSWSVCNWLTFISWSYFNLEIKGELFFVFVIHVQWRETSDMSFSNTLGSSDIFKLWSIIWSASVWCTIGAISGIREVLLSFSAEDCRYTGLPNAERFLMQPWGKGFSYPLLLKNMEKSSWKSASYASYMPKAVFTLYIAVS